MLEKISVKKQALDKLNLPIDVKQGLRALSFLPILLFDRLHSLIHSFFHSFRIFGQAGLEDPLEEPFNCPGAGDSG